jgi:hypothetical protein
MRYTVTPAAEPRYSAERSRLERMIAAIFQTAGGVLRQSLRQITDASQAPLAGAQPR